MPAKAADVVAYGRNASGYTGTQPSCKTVLQRTPEEPHDSETGRDSSKTTPYGAVFVPRTKSQPI